MIRAFKVYVRPLLEYAVSVWSPCYNYAIDKVESVQRKFTKRLRGCNNMDYSARLDHLQLQSLERRRLIADLVLTYRIIFGLIICPIAIAYSMGQIIKSVCVCLSVCRHSHGRISFSIFTKFDTEVYCKPPKVRTSTLGLNIAPHLPLFHP